MGQTVMIKHPITVSHTVSDDPSHRISLEVEFNVHVFALETVNYLSKNELKIVTEHFSIQSEMSCHFGPSLHCRMLHCTRNQ